MPRDGGRIVIIADLSPKRLLRIAEDIAVDSQCGIEDLRDDDRDGFHIYDANGEPPVYTLGTLIASSAGALRVPLDIEVSATRTKKDDGKIVLDWAETGNALRRNVCRTFTRSLADELEARIEDADGEVIESYDED
jgi:hypothetical protein